METPPARFLGSSPRSASSPGGLRAFGAVGALLWLGIAIPDLASLRVGWLAFFAAAFGTLLAFPALVTRYFGFLLKPRSVVFVGVVAAVAFAMSLAFVMGPMANKAVSIDANVYWFEARALTQGGFGATVPPPRLAYSARFLFEGADGKLHGVFPPGYPFFLAPFVRFGIPLMAGPVTALLLVLAQNALGRSVMRAMHAEDGESAARSRELGHRIGLLLPLFAFQRTLHTADLLSHAFVAALAAFALASAIDLANGRGRTQDAASIGLFVGWIFASRLLDGVLIGAVIGCVLLGGLWKKKVSLKHLGVALVCVLPMLGLLAAQQKAATGSPFTPTQSEYFVRSDWPPTCHRIGFGADIGCSVEHPDAPEKIGPDGYGLDDAARVIRERGAALGRDLFGLGLFGAFAFLVLVRRPQPAFAVLGAMILVIVLGYGLFYFGNVQWYGGRHVLPAAPFFWVLLGHALASFPLPASPESIKAQRPPLALAAAAIVTMLLGGQRAWSENSREIAARQSGRSDVRRSIARHKIERGIFRSSDGAALVAALDPVRDGTRIHLVADDRSGLLDLRRFYPDLPLVISLERDEIGTALGLAPPKPGILVELERAWPSYQRPHNLAASSQEIKGVQGVSASRALVITHASPGATLEVPFDVAVGGAYVLRLDVIAGPDKGRYSATLDGAPLTSFDGYAPAPEMRRGGDLAPARSIAAGPHTLVFRCDGKSDASSGFDATLDALVGVVSSSPPPPPPPPPP